MINLPEEYEKEMRSLLGAEFEEYKKIYEQPVRQGLRFNPYKLTKPVWEEIMPFEKEEIPWVENGYYIHGGKEILQDIPIILQVFITFRSPAP